MAAVVGRERELDRVGAFLDRREGDPRVLLIEGEAGIGKTTVWRLGVTRAAGAGQTVLSAAPSQPEHGLPFAGLADLLASSIPVLTGRLPAPQLHALRVALRLDDPDVPLDASAIAFATHGSLMELAVDGPVLVAVDDVQWLDRPSADALSFAIRRLEDHDIRVFLARRSGDHMPIAPSLANALDNADCSVVTLGPLSVGAVQRIVSDRTGAALPRPLLLRIHETSAGNPLFALELAHALAGAPPYPAGEPLPVPAALRELIERRLAELAPSATEALQVASLLAEPTPALVAVALERDTVDLDDAVLAGIVQLDGDTIRFTHPLLASGLADRLAPSARRLLHRRLAETVTSVEERALHLVASATGPDEAVAVVVDEAGASARERGASAVAAELLERGIALTDPSDHASRRRRLLAASEANRDAGDWKRAEAHARDAVDLTAGGRERAEALLALAASNPTVQLAAAEEALLHADGDARIEARAHLVVSDSLFHIDAMRSLAETREALEAATRADDPALRAAAHAAVAYMEETRLDADPSAHLDEALALERAGVVVDIEFSPATAVATVHMWRDQHDEARAGFAAASAAATARGDVYGTVLSDIHLAIVEWRAGRWAEALALAERTTTMWEASGDPGGIAVVLYGRAVVLAHLGRVDEALSDLARARDVDPPGALMAARLAWVEGQVALATGDGARAHSLLTQAAAAFDEIGLVHPGLRLYLSDAIDACLEEGDASAAAALAAPLVELGATHDLPRATAIGLRARGGILAAQGDLDAAVSTLEEATAALERFPVPFEHARTRLALGSVLRRARRRRAAREALDSALDAFEALGAELWAARAREELGRIGGRAPSPDGLTPTERRVAALVAEGKSNKEVAAALVVSVHTVEAALTSIYRKLDVHSRTEMAHKLVETG